MTATPYKRGKAIVGFEFLIESQVGHAIKMQKQKRDIKIQNNDDQLDGQMNLLDYQDKDGQIKIYW